MDKGRYTLHYRYALIPAIGMLLMFLPGFRFLGPESLLHPVLSALWMLLAAGIYIALVNRIETRLHQRLFFLLSCIALPFVLYGVLLGGLLGAYGIILGSGIPFCILIIFGGGILYKQKGMRTRCILLSSLFVSLIIAGIWLGFASRNQTEAMLCTDVTFGAWDAEKKQCTVSAEQEIRNAIFFSSVPVGDGRIFLNLAVSEDGFTHNQPGDLVGAMYVGGIEHTPAHFHADYAVRMKDIIITPFTLTESGELYLASLRIMHTWGGLPRPESISVIPVTGTHVLQTHLDESVGLFTLTVSTPTGSEIRRYTLSTAGDIVQQ